MHGNLQGEHWQGGNQVGRLPMFTMTPCVDFSLFDNDGPDGTADSGDDDGRGLTDAY